MNLYNSNQSLKEMLELTKDIIKQLKLAIESCKSKKDLSQSSIRKECLKNQIIMSKETEENYKVGRVQKSNIQQHKQKALKIKP